MNATRQHLWFFQRGKPLALALAAWMCCATLSAATAAEAALKAGEDAPALRLRDWKGELHSIDRQTSATLLLVFCAPDDRYSEKAFEALSHMSARHPGIVKDVRRAVVVPGLEGSNGLISTVKKAGESWLLLRDEDGKAFGDFKIVVTPTAMVVGADGKVKFVNPGYDLAMEDRVRKALALEEGAALPSAASSKPAKPDMDLQMGRRMAARGLWDSALAFYKKVEGRGELTLDSQMELAEIYIELERPEEALAILSRVDSAASRRDDLIGRARKLQSGAQEPAAPPKVVR
jgi:tetratricopeptide (TPR) repeat protein